VTWHEATERVIGRWIVVVPLWRSPPSCVLVKEILASERGSCELRIDAQSARPGRYEIRAVHAPWGSDDWPSAIATAHTYLDLAPQRWKDTFGPGNSKTIHELREAFLAYWHRPDLVDRSPALGWSLTADDVATLMASLIAHAQPTKSTVLNTELRRLALLRPNGIVRAFVQQALVPDAWFDALAPREILSLDATEADKSFLRDVAFQYTVLRTAGMRIRRRYANRRLSEPLRTWCEQINRTKPPLFEVVWLCERFAVFERERRAIIREYEALKDPLLVAN